MRTNIVIDDKLMEQAKRLSGLESKREVVETALREFVSRRDQSYLDVLRGSDPDLDHPFAYEDRYRTE